MSHSEQHATPEAILQATPAPLDAKQQGRNTFWSKQAKGYRQAWATSRPEADLYKELEAALLIEATGAKPGKKILDLCCGTGRNTVALAHTGAQMWGIDGAEGMLEQARQHAIDQDIDNATFQQGDSRSLPFSDNTFDGVTGTRFMYMMSPDEKQQIIQEVHRVLKPGGRAAIHFNCGLWGIKQELLNLGKGRQFRLRSRYLWPGQTAGLFEGFQVDGLIGVKIPRLALLSRLTGRKAALVVNRLLRFFPFRHLSAYAIVIATCRK